MVYPQLETLLTYPTLAITPFVFGHAIAPQEFRMICYDHQAMTCVNGFKSQSPFLDVEPILYDDVVSAGLLNEEIDGARLNHLKFKFPSMCNCYNVHDDIYGAEHPRKILSSEATAENF
jgi:hypothetical protein